MTKVSPRTLIIKLGSLGDLLRTTPILRILKGEVWWVTSKEGREVFCLNSKPGFSFLTIEEAPEKLFRTTFDLVISLDDDRKAAQFASQLSKEQLVGSFIDKSGNIAYTESAAEWFDMGLISRLGKEKADELKKQNRKSYQDMIFGMLGERFSGEEYLLGYEDEKKESLSPKAPYLVGIETRAGKRWPTKQWHQYDQLMQLLVNDGLEVKMFTQKPTLAGYIREIARCNLVVTGDTLALHIALALKKKVVAIFICTSPAEIYDYGRMTKIVSPQLERAFYRQDYIPEAIEAVTLKEVYQKVQAEICGMMLGSTTGNPQ